MEIESHQISEQEFQRTVIKTISEKYGFEEIFEIIDSSNVNEEIQIKKIKKGVYKDEDNYLGIICKFVNITCLKISTQNFLNNFFIVENIYVGERFLLCNANNKIYSFDIELYNIINSIIEEVDSVFGLDYKIIKIGVDPNADFHILIIETQIAFFLLAGIVTQSPEEVERVILSNRIKSSQSFFEFKTPIQFEWSSLIGDKDRQFERICELLLQREMNISRIIPIGKTRASDRGRDFEVIERVEGIQSYIEKRWLVQCKFSEQSISPSTIAGWTDRIIEHKYDGYWLMTNNDITPSLFDQFKDVENNANYKIKVRFWQRSDFHIKLNVNSELFTKNDIFKID